MDQEAGLGESVAGDWELSPSMVSVSTIFPRSNSRDERVCLGGSEGVPLLESAGAMGSPSAKHGKNPRAGQSRAGQW